MRVIQRIVTPFSASTTAIAASQHMTAGTALTQSSTPYVIALPASGDFTVNSDGPRAGRNVTLTSTANLSAINFTIVGFDRYGAPITEVLAGPNNNTVNSKFNYGSVTSITPGTTDGTNNVSAGYASFYYTPWIIMGNYRQHWQSVISVQVDAAATVNYDIQATDQSLNDPQNPQYGDYTDEIITLASSQTAATNSAMLAGYAYVRLKVNSLSGGNIKLRLVPSATA